MGSELDDLLSEVEGAIKSAEAVQTPSRPGSVTKAQPAIYASNSSVAQQQPLTNRQDRRAPALLETSSSDWNISPPISRRPVSRGGRIAPPTESSAPSSEGGRSATGTHKGAARSTDLASVPLREGAAVDEDIDSLLKLFDGMDGPRNDGGNGNDTANSNGSRAFGASPTATAAAARSSGGGDSHHHSRSLFGASPRAALPSSSPPQFAAAAASGTPRRRCAATCLAGEGAARGFCPSVSSRVACDALRCTGCDFAVERFEGQAWGALADYMFFRLNAPDRFKLAAMLQPAPGRAAYACQCSWHNVAEVERLGPNSELRWMCGGH